MNERDMTWFQDLSLNLLRFWAGFQLWQHGAQKLFAVLGRETAAEAFTLIWVAGVIEFFGGLMIALGLFTRPVAFILCGHMAVIFWWRHFPPFWPVMNRGEVPVLLCFMFLLLWAWGGGRYSLDAWLRNRKSSD